MDNIQINKIIDNYLDKLPSEFFVPGNHGILYFYKIEDKTVKDILSQECGIEMDDNGNIIKSFKGDEKELQNLINKVRENMKIKIEKKKNSIKFVPRFKVEERKKMLEGEELKKFEKFVNNINVIKKIKRRHK